MKKKIFIGVGVFLAIFVIAAGVFYLAVMRPAFQKQEQVRQMPIKDVEFANVADGTYEGSFTYSKTTTEVEVTVKGHKIEKINILEKGKTEHAQKAAEGIEKNVLEAQSLDVDVVTGATTTSKALLKALEKALKQGIS
jgi:uncharacterized protein with FMN-binding domain